MTADGRLAYQVTFSRISRNHNVTPLELTVDDGLAEAIGDQIAEAVYRYAKPKVLSRELEVYISYGSDDDPHPATSADIDGATGSLIVGGFQSAGQFTVKAVTP